jgi:hypothetical protein
MSNRQLKPAVPQTNDWQELDTALESAYNEVYRNSFENQHYKKIEDIDNSIAACQEMIALYENLKSNLQRLNLTAVPYDYQ